MDNFELEDIGIVEEGMVVDKVEDMLVVVVEGMIEVAVHKVVVEENMIEVAVHKVVVEEGMIEIAVRMFVVDYIYFGCLNYNQNSF